MFFFQSSSLSDLAACRSCKHCGFALIEVVLSMGVLAAVLPLLMLGLVKVSGGNRDADEETRAIFIARSLRSELQLAREGRGEFLEEVGFLAEFGGGRDQWVFLVGGDGDLIGEGSALDVTEGCQDDGIRFLAIVSIDLDRSVSLLSRGVDELMEVRMRVESPAQAPEGRRRRHSFVYLMRGNER